MSESYRIAAELTRADGAAVRIVATVFPTMADPTVTSTAGLKLVALDGRESCNLVADTFGVSHDRAAGVHRVLIEAARQCAELVRRPG